MRTREFTSTDDAPRTNPLLARSLFSIYPVTVSIEYPHYCRVPRLHIGKTAERPPRWQSARTGVGRLRGRERSGLPRRPRAQRVGRRLPASHFLCVHFGAIARSSCSTGKIVNHHPTACVPDSNHVLRTLGLAPAAIETQNSAPPCTGAATGSPGSAGSTLSVQSAVRYAGLSAVLGVTKH